MFYESVFRLQQNTFKGYFIQWVKAIAPNSEIGSGCDLYAGVRLVLSHGNKQGPRLGSHVFMGDGAKAVGAVSIGDHAIIGVSAVVTKDIPANATAVGIPAKVITLDNQRSSEAP